MKQAWNRHSAWCWLFHRWRHWQREHYSTAKPNEYRVRCDKANCGLTWWRTERKSIKPGLHYFGADDRARCPEIWHEEGSPLFECVLVTPHVDMPHLSHDRWIWWDGGRPTPNHSVRIASTPPPPP